MWRIGDLARMSGVSGHTLRHYDRIGLLPPAAVDRANGYRWYGAAELARLERIRGLRHLGLSLRRIADLLDAPEPQVRQALEDTVAALRRDIAEMSAVVEAVEDRLAVGGSVLPQWTHVSARKLRVRHVDVGHPSELSGLCGSTLLTWLTTDSLRAAATTDRAGPSDAARTTGPFRAAVTTDRAGEKLTLPARSVVRAVVPPAVGVVRAGRDLFAWLGRRRLATTGPTVEDHLVDGDGATVTVLEIAVG